ncbi:phage head closure protein [Glaciimonas sp. GNP009]
MSTLSTQLDKRVQIQARATGLDDDGEPLGGWSNVATVWASIVDISGHEYVRAAAVQNAVQTKIVIRYRLGVVPAMRVLFGSDRYNIEAVLGQDQRALLLMCSRAV